MTRFDRTLNEQIRHLVTDAQTRNVLWPVATPVLITAPVEVLKLPEVREHVVPRPTRSTACRPPVIVTGIAPRPEHGIDRATATNNLATRELADAAVSRPVG